MLYLVFLLLLSVSLCQTLDTLTIQSEVTDVYKSYLSVKEGDWEAKLLEEVGDDTSGKMNAHMGLALIRLAWAQVDGDVMITDLEPIATDIDDQITDLESFIEDEVVPDISELKFIDLFFSETFDPDSYDFSDSLFSLMETLVNKIDLLGPPIETFLDSLDVGFSNKNFDNHIHTVKNGTAEFTFYLEIESYDTLIFNREYFENQKALDQHNFDMNSSIDDGFDCLDQYYNGPLDDNIFNTCITHFREGIDYGIEWCNTLETIITNEPIVAFDVDTDFIDELRSIFNEIDELSNGTEYDIGPSSEGKTIKPLNILRALHDGLATELREFYFSTNPNTYDFGGIFPQGLNQHVIDQISADAVIYADYNDDNSLMDRWIEMEEDWQTLVDGGSVDPDPHMGLSFSKFLQLFDSTIGQLSEAFDYLDDGKVDLFYNTWRDIDISDDIDEIIDHLEKFSDARDAMFIVLVIEDEYNTGDNHDIQSSTDFSAIPLHSINAAIVLDISNGMINGLQTISDLSSEFYTNIDDKIDMDLNPNYLDFSEINNALDLIDIFKQSNPNWLSLTDEGVEWFHNTGTDLEDAFEEIYSFCIQLDDSLQNNNMTLLMGEEFDFDSIKDLSEQLYNDFSDPATSTEIDGENINFSAWFDYPPPSFLTLWENVELDDDSPDNSLYCLFPDEPTNLICDGCSGIPDGECDCNGNVKDCAGECGGNAVVSGCDNTCGSNLENDECGVCGGNGCYDQDCDTYPSSDYDCLGITLSIFDGIIPEQYSIYNIYPNPFNPVTNITYGLPEYTKVQIIIYDLSGKQVQSLINGIQGPGYHSVVWNADKYSSGMYLLRIYANGSTFGEYVSTQKILLIK